MNNFKESARQIISKMTPSPPNDRNTESPGEALIRQQQELLNSTGIMQLFQLIRTSLKEQKVAYSIEEYNTAFWERSLERCFLPQLDGTTWHSDKTQNLFLQAQQAKDNLQKKERVFWHTKVSWKMQETTTFGSGSQHFSYVDNYIQALVDTDNSDVILCGETSTLIPFKEWNQTSRISSVLLEKLAKPRTIGMDGRYSPDRAEPSNEYSSEIFSDGR
ncbi:MAG: hypothetical protein WAV51_03980 [Microgenomates group bacterium]